ncbi:uncharacterized protein LOC120346538 [Styela clava]
MLLLYRITCQELDELFIPDDTYVSCTSSNNLDSVCTITCPEQMSLKGAPDEVACLDEDGDSIAEWSREFSLCTLIECEPLEQSQFTSETSFSCSNEAVIGSECVFQCQEGTRLPVSSTSFFCKDIDSDRIAAWDPPVESCVYLPIECTSHLSGHSVECINAIWIDGGCNNDGIDAPPKLSASRISELENIPLSDLLQQFEGLKSSAVNGDSISQRKCVGFAYPETCTNLDGPHTDACLISLWLIAGCSQEGTRHPQSLASAQREELNSMSLRNVIDDFNKTYEDAASGIDLKQLQCYGLVFPTHCMNYNGPHSIECLETIWLSAKCLEEGNDSPEKRDEIEFTRLNGLNLRDIINEFNNTFALADGGDEDKQMSCFGMVYPTSCINYYGAHSIDCLKTVWNSATCTPEGSEYPEKLSTPQHENLNNKNLKELATLFNALAQSANDGSEENQLKCFGIVYPENCENYYGSHSVDCLKTMWLSAKCTQQGSKYPEIRDTADLARLNGLNLREVLLEFNETYNAAESGDSANQDFCFGMAYPINCAKYYGSHSLECLETIWLSAKCLEEGSKYPNKLDETELNKLNELNLREVSLEFTNIFDAAESGDVDSQGYCLGISYPESCVNYYGPHALNCLNTMWLTAKCLLEGSKYPEKRDETDLSRLNGLNLREVIIEFNNTFISAENNDPDNQNYCLGLVYPDECTNYYGPHPVDCLKTIWFSVKCLVEGTWFPEKRDASEIARLGDLDIRELILEFNNTFNTAENGDVNSQEHCHGISYPENCQKYFGPHSLECLETMWLSARCLREGSKFPAKRDSNDLSRLDGLNIREVVSEFNYTYLVADNGDSNEQTFCFGILYPSNCEKYYGPHTVECLETIWLSVSCLEEGSKYPSKLDMTELDRLNGLNIR